MEKTLTIDGKSVRFKSNAATPFRYKAQFGSDLFGDIVKLYPLTKIDFDNKDPEEFAKAFRLMDFDMFYNILWVHAKTANKEIPEPIDWLEQFDEFPLMHIFTEIQDLLMKSMQLTKKK